jgi:hypothetical protein
VKAAVSACTTAASSKPARHHRAPRSSETGAG